MIRKIIKINKEKCNGCGICAKACHEGAIGIADGKAELLREDYCDGLGDCLPACPTGAITFEEREALAYDEQAVKLAKAQKAPLACGCAGTHAKTIAPNPAAVCDSDTKVPNRLAQWPVQIKLIPANAPYLDGADLLIAADCTAYAYGNFHNDFMRDKITLIGCPKLDATDYSQKLTEILLNHTIKSITVARMSVPCCGGIEHAAKQAVANSKKAIPLNVRIISTDGNILI